MKSINLYTLVFQFACAITVFSAVYAWYFLPYVRKQPIHKQFELLLLPFLLRYIGAQTLATEVVSPSYSKKTAWVVAICDPLCVFLALLAIFFLRKRSKASYWFVLLFILEFLVYQGIALSVDWPYGLIKGLGAHWYVGVVYVPLLVIAQFVIMFYAFKYGKELREAD